MKIRYKGILCNLSTYRVMNEDRPALYPVTQSNDKVFYQEFDEVHYTIAVEIG
ncbi:hypothetical protein [Roseburia intestinalis]|uniref:hypothetical protein n=1 Tax=Roseburia intestinalis TaxID=166486 RepID=UPI0015FD2FDB|nr:hypothetical protein [Roseburia intestinalis]